jgi:hypothetical protein
MIYAMHGVVRSPSLQLLIHNWMTDAERFASFLSKRSPFVALGRALEGEGDALTIDDATRAAQEAALLARDHGHEVTLFINSQNVKDSFPYYLHVLSSILDSVDSSQLAMLRKKYVPSEFPTHKKSIRQFFKHRLSRLPDERSRQDLLDVLASDMGISEVSLPAHLRTLSPGDLAELTENGVQLENHGASHAHFSIFHDCDARAQIAECRSWLLTNFAVESRYFAVPFGDVLPRFEVSNDVASCWFIQEELLQAGFVGPKIYNRADLRV